MTRLYGLLRFWNERTEPQRLWILGAGAVFLRLLAALTTSVVAADGSRYLRMARLMYEDAAFGEALRIQPMHHPVYPLLIAFGNFFTGDMAAAGAVISALLGGAAIVPLYLLIRAAWNDRVATIASVLYLFLPEIAVLQGEVMTEGTFMFFFFTAMALSWFSLEKGSWTLAVLAGMVSALAWLTRPEGIYLLPLFVFACLWYLKRSTPPLWSGNRGETLASGDCSSTPSTKGAATTFTALGLYAATFLVLAYPYLLFIKAQTGHWGISANPFSAGILGLVTGETKPKGYQLSEKGVEEFSEYRYQKKFGRFGGATLYIGQTISKILFYVLTPFWIIGFFMLRPFRERPGPSLFVLVAALGYFIPPVLSFVAGTPFGYRYILPSVVLTLPGVALGLMKASEWIRKDWVLTAFMVTLCTVMAVKTVLPKRVDKLALKMAGEAIRKNLGENKRIAGTRREIEYYARGQYFELPPQTSFEKLEQVIADKNIDVIALYVHELRNYPPDLLERIEKKYVLLGEYPPVPDKKVKPVQIYTTRRRRIPP